MDLTTDIRDEGLVLAGMLDFVEKAVVPLEETLGETFTDPRRHFPGGLGEAPEITTARRAVRMASARAGYYAMFTPSDVGGAGLGERLFFLAWEALHLKYGPGEHLMYNVIAHWASGPSAVWRFVQPGLREEVYPKIVSGELQGCFGMSEPDAGSDAWRMRSRAQRDGDEWIINGSKQWTSFSPTADYVVVFAVTDQAAVEARKGGITCFYVPTSAPGFAVESVIKLFGEIGGREGILSFDDVRASDGDRIGDEGDGFAIAMVGVTQGRLYNTARSVGLSRWAMELALRYAKHRQTFGKPIAEHQAIQFMLADSAVEIYAARQMGLDFAQSAQNGKDVRREAAMAKLFATNAATRIFDRAMQVHGGMGITNEIGLFEGWKTARTIRIADGSDEILRRTIARELLKGNVGFGEE